VPQKKFSAFQYRNRSEQEAGWVVNEELEHNRMAKSEDNIDESNNACGGELKRWI
jgi:hypothetical protein